MKNIYEIKDELRELLLVIEDADGEITEEIGVKFDIAEEELGEKILSYHGIIQERKGQIQVVKDEVERLRMITERNNRIIDKLKSKVLDAVNEFGYTGKSGNKKVDLETLKAYTVNSDKLIIDDEENFNDPRFCFKAINVPSDFNIVNKVLTYLSNISEDKDLITELNKELKTTISRKKLKDALDLGTKVRGASTVNEPFIVMR